MNIRCERCSTTYELDEKLLAAEGSPVQCTKCQHVFTAVPPRAAGRTLVGVPAAPPPAPPAAPRARPPEPATSRQGPAIYKPSHSPASSVVRTPRPKRDTMGAFEARLRSNARLRWLVPAAAGGVVLLVVAGWLLLSGGVDPAVQRKHAEAMALVAQDDMASLEKAGQAFDELSRQRTGLETIVADRALAQLLLATGLVEDVSGPAERLARKVAERDRMAALQPAPEGLAALTAEVEGLRGQVEPRQAKARALTEQAYAALKQVSGERGGEVAVARALAIYFASIGDREQALRFIRAAPGAADRDPWIRLAEAWLDVREEGKEPRERGVGKLTTLVGNHPEIVRARYLLARTQALLGRKEQAAATLDGLLAANPGHQRARRFREELVVPTGQPAAAAPAVAPRPLLPRAPVAPLPPGAAPAAPLPQLPAAAQTPAVPKPPSPAAVPQHVPAPAPATVVPATPAVSPRPVAPSPAPAAKPVGPAPVGPAPAHPKPAGTVPPPVVAPAQPPAPVAPAPAAAPAAPAPPPAAP